MNIVQCIITAVQNVVSNKMRAFLTMLGIIIGVGSVIMISSLGAGSTAQMQSQFESMGVGRLTVRMAGGRDISRSDMMTLKDYEAVAALDGIKLISPTLAESVTLKLLNPKETKTASVTGVFPGYKEIMSPTILYGRYILDNDVDMNSKVVVINDTTATKVFGYCNESLLGEKITLRTWKGSQKYTVVGITENKNASMEEMYGDQFPESITMPLTTTQRLTGNNQIDSMTVVAIDENDLDTLSANITTALDTLHKTTDKYYVQNTMQMMEQITNVMGTVTLFISCVAGISLFVGGIGVMNIMLVTVTERTREIGIRKSIGAKNKDILFQFLIEAVILTGIGGLIGFGVGIGGGTVAGTYMNMTPVVSVSSIVLAVGISTLIGVVFGVIPANKAAKLDPIEALRYE